jgi:uridine kinase
VANLDSAIERIVETHRRVPADRCTLVAISGIDASGKGYLAANMVQALRTLDLHVANINIDGWLNLPQVRFRKNYPAENFYRNAIRFRHVPTVGLSPPRQRITAHRDGLCRGDRHDLSETALRI